MHGCLLPSIWGAPINHVEGFTPHHKVSLGGSELLAKKNELLGHQTLGINRHIVR